MLTAHCLLLPHTAVSVPHHIASTYNIFSLELESYKQAQHTLQRNPGQIQHPLGEIFGPLWLSGGFSKPVYLKSWCLKAVSTSYKAEVTALPVTFPATLI